jgi:hypothetical protein
MGAGLPEGIDSVCLIHQGLCVAGKLISHRKADFLLALLLILGTPSLGEVPSGF